MVQSRFTGSTAIAFEFQRTEAFPNQPTLFVSHVLVNFTTAPTTEGNVQLFISDGDSKDLIWGAEAQSQTHLSFSPALHVPIAIGEKLILEYKNADSAEVTARFLWRV